MNSRKVTAIILAAAMTVTSALPAFAAEADAAAIDIDAAAVATDIEAEAEPEAVAQAAETPEGVGLSGSGEVVLPGSSEAAVPTEPGKDGSYEECIPMTTEEIQAFVNSSATAEDNGSLSIASMANGEASIASVEGIKYHFTGWKWEGFKYTSWNVYYCVVYENAGYSYTGKKVKPLCSVHQLTSFADEPTLSNLLTEGKHYKLILKNAKNANGGAWFRVKGKGKHSKLDTMSKSLKPSPKKLTYTINSITFDNTNITIPDYSVAYKAGKTQMKKPTYAYIGSTKLSKKDYLVEFTDMGKSGSYESPGSYAVTIKPGTTGNITGSKKITLTVSDKPQARKFKVKYAKKQYASGSGVKPSVEVTFKKTPLTQGKDYKVSYANNVYPGKGLIIIQGIGEYTGTVVKMFKIKS